MYFPNLILLGDDIFQNFSALLSAKILAKNLNDCPFLIPIHQEELSFESCFHEIPQYIIGKAPYYLVISLGLVEVTSSKSLPVIFDEIDAFFQQIEINIQPQKFILGVCEILFSGHEQQMKKARKINQYLKQKFPKDYVDMNYSIKRLFKQVRESEGEKQALHQIGPKLTIFGQHLFSEIASRKICTQLLKKG